MVTPRGESYSAPSGSGVYGGMSAAPTEPTEIVADGIWTWFSAPIASVRNGALYLSTVDSAGTCRITRRDLTTGETSTVNLSSVALEVDDHNNGSHHWTDDGRLVAWYGKHNDSVGLRYKVATSADSISGFSAEQQRGGGAGNISYPNSFRFSQLGAPELVMFRRNRDGAADRALCFRTSPDFASPLPASISAYTDLWAIGVNDTPYWRMASDGINTVHIFATNRHPVQGQVSLYHLRMTLNASNVWEYFTSAGAPIVGAPPFGAASATLVYDGSSVKCWVSDAAIDGTGAPVCLWMRYPGNDGSAIEYWHSRWNGSAWIGTKITDDGAGLYSGERYYHGGLCFDSEDAAIVYLSAPIGGVRQIQRWATSDHGGSWTRTAVITSGGAAGSPLRGRPMSPKNHGGLCPVIWWEGAYTTYMNYATKVMGLV